MTDAQNRGATLAPFIHGAPRALVDIKWQETSGVDHPANEEEGWMVMKTAEEVSVTTELAKAVEEEMELIKAHEVLGGLLQKLRDGETLAQAPDHVQKAADTLLAWFDQLGYIAKSEASQSVEATSPLKLSARERMYRALRSLIGRAQREEKAAKTAPGTSEQEEVQELMRAFAKNWPPFIASVVTMKKSGTASRDALEEAVSKLSASIFEALTATAAEKADSADAGSVEGIICPHCGALNDAEAGSCKQCGTDLSAA